MSAVDAEVLMTNDAAAALVLYILSEESSAGLVDNFNMVQAEVAYDVGAVASSETQGVQSIVTPKVANDTTSVASGDAAATLYAQAASETPSINASEAQQTTVQRPASETSELGSADFGPAGGQLFLADTSALVSNEQSGTFRLTPVSVEDSTQLATDDVAHLLAHGVLYDSDTLLSGEQIAQLNAAVPVQRTDRVCSSEQRAILVLLLLARLDLLGTGERFMLHRRPSGDYPNIKPGRTYADTRQRGPTTATTRGHATSALTSVRR